MARGKSASIQFTSVSPEAAQFVAVAISGTGAAPVNRVLKVGPHSRPFSGKFVFPNGSKFSRFADVSFRIQLEASQGVPTTFTVVNEFALKRNGQAFVYPDVLLGSYSSLERSFVDEQVMFQTDLLPAGNYVLEGTVRENRTGLQRDIRAQVYIS